MRRAPQDEDMSMDEILASIRKYVKGETESYMMDNGYPSAQLSCESTGKRTSQVTPSHAAKSVAPKTIQLTAADEWNPDSGEYKKRAAEQGAVATSLISENVRVSTQHHLDKVARANASHKPDSAHNLPSGSDCALDEFVARLLNPLLKQWLEHHLPDMVGRIVEREIRQTIRQQRD